IRASRCRAASPMLSPDHPSRARQRWQWARSKCTDEESIGYPVSRSPLYPRVPHWLRRSNRHGSIPPEDGNLVPCLQACSENASIRMPFGTMKAIGLVSITEFNEPSSQFLEIADGRRQLTGLVAVSGRSGATTKHSSALFT